jgi:DNA-binding XRE family transcriptional regulator
MLLAEALQRYRSDNRLSLRDLAKEVDISVPNLRLLEGGWLIPQMRTLRKVAKLFRWTPEEVAVIAQDIPDEAPRMWRQSAGAGPSWLSAGAPAE